MANPVENLNEMLLIRREKLQNLQEEGRNPFLIEKYDVTHHSADIKEDFSELEGKNVSVAGRVMSKRGHGKISFLDLQDMKGKIQIFAKKDLLGEEYNYLKLWDIGDIVGVRGEVFKTEAGEVSIRAQEVVY